MVAVRRRAACPQSCPCWWSWPRARHGRWARTRPSDRRARGADARRARSRRGPGAAPRLPQSGPWAAGARGALVKGGHRAHLSGRAADGLPRLRRNRRYGPSSAIRPASAHRRIAQGRQVPRPGESAPVPRTPEPETARPAPMPAPPRRRPRHRQERRRAVPGASAGGRRRQAGCGGGRAARKHSHSRQATAQAATPTSGVRPAGPPSRRARRRRCSTGSSAARRAGCAPAGGRGPGRASRARRGLIPPSRRGPPRSSRPRRPPPRCSAPPGTATPAGPRPRRMARSQRTQWLTARREHSTPAASSASARPTRQRPAQVRQELVHREAAADQRERGAQPGQEGPLVGQGEAVVRGPPSSRISRGRTTAGHDARVRSRPGPYRRTAAPGLGSAVARGRGVRIPGRRPQRPLLPAPAPPRNAGRAVTAGARPPSAARSAGVTGAARQPVRYPAVVAAGRRAPRPLRSRAPPPPR